MFFNNQQEQTKKKNIMMCPLFCALVLQAAGVHVDGAENNSWAACPFLRSGDYITVIFIAQKDKNVTVKHKVHPGQKTIHSS